MITTVIGIRVSLDEKALIDTAAALEAQLGDRGGATAWARRVVLREAKRVVDAAAAVPPSKGAI